MKMTRIARADLPTQKAFTLIELLTVMAVIGLLTTLCIPALSSLTKGGQMNQSVAELAGLLDQARQYAISQNTYVWVALSPDIASTDGPQLGVTVLASKTGVDPAPAGGNYGAVPNDQIALISKPKAFSQFKFEEAGVFGIGKIPNLPTRTAANVGTASFSIKLPGASSATTFSRVITFTPAGEARVTSSPIDLIEFGVHPTRGSVTDDNNVAVLRVNGLTGQTTVYRP